MRHSSLFQLSPSLLGLLLSTLLTLSVLAQPATLSFSDCTSGNAIDPAKKINVSTVYGQIVTGENLGRHLNLTVIGNTGQDIIPISNSTGLLSTLFTTSSILSFNIWENSTFFCSSLRPPSPLPAENSSYYYCPVSTGPVAFSTAIPLGSHQYELLTINTRLRIVDTSLPAIELACVDISATPLYDHRVAGSIYNDAVIIFWFSVALAIAYWVVIGLARIVAAWGRGGTGSSRSAWSRLEGAGYILASAISGERFAAAPALLRFSTPSMRDIIFHTQYCAVLGMVAVQWPVFAYPMLAQTAWSTLLYNITLAQSGNATITHWNPLTVQDYNPSSDFADQLSDPTSAIYVDASVPNSLLMLPENASAGIASFAAIVGLRPQDLFGVCLVLFLAIVGATIVISLVIWGVDQLGVALSGEKGSPFGSRSPAYMAPPKDSDKNELSSAEHDGTSAVGHFLFRSTSIPLSSALNRNWWIFRIKPNSFHGSILHGNLVRVLILFHLPITLFASYQFSNARSQSSLVSVILASLSFAVFSVGIPVFLIVRLYTTATNKLFDETRTLMILGPLYNHYGHGSQLFACIFFANNLVYGVTIGCGQKSGIAQAIIILVTEVVASLSTSIWLPWGRGATMGLISFFFCVCRITVAVLLVILTPTVSVGDAAGSWVAAAILFILGLMYLAFLMIVAIKIVEALLRVIGQVPFDRSKHSLDSGLLGVLGLLGYCKPAKRRHRRSRRPATSPSHVGSQQQFVIGNENSSSTPPSSSRGPPSVLRPEHALRPYREDSDDESGFIMGAWQPFPQPGYGPVNDRPPSPVVETVPKSGFARIGGGRAHYDSPFAIQEDHAATTSKHEFPSVERVHQSTPTPPPRASETPTNRSTVTVNHAVATGLPPGAMSPARPQVHVRTKSQTAIIEDASVLFNLQSESSAVIQNPKTGGHEDPLPPPKIPVETDDSSSDVAQPKRTHWYTFRKSRRMSEGNLPVKQPDDGGGRSFVVLRDKRSSAAAPLSAGAPTNDAPAGEEERRSFVVLRGNNASEDSSSAPSRTIRRLSQA